MKEYLVTSSIDYLDTKPIQALFYTLDEAQEYMVDIVQRRTQWTVSHSPYLLSDEEVQHIEETEWSLIKLEEV
jgi:hypothetical protein